MDLVCWMPLPTGIDPASLPDLAHYRSQGIDRIVARCLTPFETTKLLAVNLRLKRC
jgi:hypothetical protein